MTEIVINTDNLPEIGEKCLQQIQTFFNSCWIKMQKYIGYVLCVSLILTMTLAILITQLKNSSVTVNPCLSYSDSTLASQVSIKCIQFIWSYYMCSNPPVFPPDGYSGWWTRSPNGQVLVNCNMVTDLTKCGVGTYGNILLYMRKCNANYMGQGL